MLRASVVIAAYNASDTLPACLQALDHQTAPERLAEVIVVDDGSTDDTALIARQAGVQVLRQTHRGAAAARNLGARHAIGDILLFTDADCEPAEDWVETMLEPFARDPAIVGVKGVYTTRQRALAARVVQLEYEDKYRRMARRESIDFIDTYSAGYRRAVFLQYGGFDESFPGANVEDQEFSFRLAEAGLKMVFQPCAVVAHRHADTFGRYLRKKFWIGFWKVKVHIRHPSKAVSDSHTPPELRVQIGLLAVTLLALVAGLVWRFGFVLAGICFGSLTLSTVPFVIRAWHRDRVAALISPLFFVGRAASLGFGFTCGLLNQFLRRMG